MDFYSFRHIIYFFGALAFVLVWIVKNIDYENLKKWRWGIVNENWTYPAKLLLFVVIVVCTINVYLLMVSVSN